MPQQISSIEVQSPLGVTVRSRFTYHEPKSERLLVLLPGRGYTCDHPLLHYLRKIGLQQGYDVLSLRYGFQVADGELKTEETAYLLEEVTQALAQVYPRGYQRLCVAGKSLGTPLAVQVAKDAPTAETSLLLLTPIGGALHSIGELNTLAIIGTADPLYTPELVNAFANEKHLRWEVYAELNHSLEAHDDWRESLANLSQILDACEQFLTA